MQKKLFEDFLNKVRTGNDAFMLTDGTEFNAFVQFAVNENAKLIFSDYCYHHCSASDILDMNLKPVALVCNSNVYLIDDFRFRHALMTHKDKWEDWFPQVFRFTDMLESVRGLLLNNLIPKLYDNLPKTELEEDRIDSAKEEARRRLLHKELFTKERPLANMEDLLTKEAFIRVLCGELNLEAHVTEQFLRNEKTWANIKAYNEEIQKHIDSPICATWEMELADAIHDAGAKMVNMTFAFEGNTVTAKVKVDEFLRVFMNGHDIDKWCFSSRAEGAEILKELGASYKYPLYAYHIDEVIYGGKSIYTAPEEAKSLRGDVLEQEDNYER